MQIIVKRPEPCGKYLYLDVEASDTIDAILARIAEIDGSPVEQFGLYLRLVFPVGKLDEGLFTLSDYFIPDRCTLFLKQQFQINIVTLAGKMFTVEVEASMDIDAVKSELYYQNGKPEILDSRFTELVVGTTKMDRKKCVVDYELKQGSRVQCLLSHAPEDISDISDISDIEE